MKKYAPVISFSDALVDDLFPFLLVLDEDLRVVKFGRKIPKVHPEIALEMPLLDAFSIHRPRLHRPSFATLQRAGSVFFLDAKTTKIRLRGQIVLEEQRGLLLFIGTPWFTDIAELEKSGFELRDFTLHDPIMDFLYMVQAKTLALEDTQRLTEAMTQLEKKSRELEQANAAKSQFLANTSHELRTPLNGIIGMASLLARTPLDGQQRHYLNTTLKSAKALLAVVNDILDISKIEAGKLSLDITDFNLYDLLDSINDVFSVAAHQKGLELLCVTDREVPALLRGDPARLRQIIDNFLSNALKFTHKGEIAMHIKLVETRDEVVVLRFSIKDVGVVSCHGERNIPDGECFSSPVKDSVEGVISYNAPTIYQGIAFDSVKLEFSKGQIVKVVADVYAEAPVTGKVTNIGLRADNAFNYDVEIEVSNPKNNPMRAGMHAKATFTFDANRQGLTLPRKAIAGSLQDAKVYVVLQDSLVQARTIRVGGVYHDKVEVVSGLQQSDRVVVTGQLNLSDGAKVQVLE